MQVPWPHRKCILCLGEKLLTDEHVIPEAIGGRLVVKFLCKSCNDRLGHAVDAAAKRDPSIALAIHRFGLQHPANNLGLDEGLPYIVESAGGRTRAAVRKGRLRVRQERLSDGSLIQPTDIARRSVEVMLRKAGYPDTPLQGVLADVDAVRDDERLEIAPGLEIVKWRMGRVAPDLSRSFSSPLLATKIAYEFLACHVGSGIYSNARALRAIRAALRNGAADQHTRVERLEANQKRQLHGIVVEAGKPYVRVQIRLFGWIAYRVHFLRIGFRGTRYAYTHEIESSGEGVRPVPFGQTHEHCGG